MSKLIVRDKSNDEIISVCEIEDLWVNGQPIDVMPTEVNITKLQTQTAIECLKEIKEELRKLDNKYKPKTTSDLISVLYNLDNYCDNKIKELEEEK